MATSIPVSTKQSNPRSTPVTLEYSGKTPAFEVLSANYKPCDLVLSNTGSSNLLFFDDNLNALKQMLANPDIKEKINLAYIDPPFSTGGLFECKNRSIGYQDLLSGSEYIEFLRKRLILIHELLSETGSLYVHLDSNMVFHVKLILDEIFGPQNFRNMITRKKCSNKNYTKKTYGDICDYILFYTKTSNYVWNKPFDPWSEEKILKEYPCIDSDGRRYKKVPIHAPGVRNGDTGGLWHGMLPPQGKHWQYTPSKLDQLDAAGEIYWSPTGNPRRKLYYDPSKGISVQNIWMDYRDSINQNDKVTGYPTEKNILMLKKIIAASSNPGDYVLDCFCGSGSTLDAAYQLKRNWIGVDQSLEAMRATIKRFSQGVERFGECGTKTTKQMKITAELDCKYNIFSSTDNVEVLNSILLEFGLRGDNSHF